MICGEGCSNPLHQTSLDWIPMKSNYHQLSKREGVPFSQFDINTETRHRHGPYVSDLSNCVLCSTEVITLEKFGHGFGELELHRS